MERSQVPWEINPLLVETNYNNMPVEIQQIIEDAINDQDDWPAVQDAVINGCLELISKAQLAIKLIRS